MDFFKEVKAKLEELEELSRQAQGAAQPSSSQGMFKPKKGPPIRPAKVVRQPAPRRIVSKEVFGDPGGTQRRSRQPVNADSCPVESRPAQVSEPSVTLKRSILDDLGERLDEAFLLHEILGPPMCLRESE